MAANHSEEEISAQEVIELATEPCSANRLNQTQLGEGEMCSRSSGWRYFIETATSKVMMIMMVITTSI